MWGSENDHGFIDAGYDEPILATYRERTGRDASERAGDDAEWLAFRAEYVTRFLREARARIRAVVPEAVFTTTILAGEPDVYLRSFQDWPAWVDEGIIDEFHLWFRTDDDLEAVARQTRHAADIVSGRVPMVVELSCYHVGSFQEHDPLVEAGRRARANGADAVGVYRHHAVDQLDLWDALAEIGRLP